MNIIDVLTAPWVETPPAEVTKQQVAIAYTVVGLIITRVL
jgi:hypothetical protein